jgi:acetyltransferase
LRRAGVIRVDDLADLFEAAEITGRYRPLQRARVAIITNGGGAGVLAVDHLLDDHAELAEFSPGTMTALDAVLPSTWSHANPIDIIGDAPPERYRAAVRTAAGDPGVDALLVMNCPTALADPSAAATAVAAEVERGLINGKPLLGCWLGRKTADPARDILQAAGIGDFETPSGAAEAIGLLTRWSTLRERLQQVPVERHAPCDDRSVPQAILHAAAAEGRTLLTEDEAKAVLAAYGVPVPRTIVAATADAVEQAAATLLADATAVVVKVRSKAISHKSDLGGVALNLTTAVAAAEAAHAMIGRFAGASPAIPIEAFTVQPMIQRKGQELIIGLSTDPSFGPVVMFGAGGTAVEVIDDTATELVPLDDVLAGDLIERTRISRQLAGYRDRRPADRAAIISSLVAVSQMAIDFPMIQGIDINPLVADADGVIALDARIEIDPAKVSLSSPSPSLAIRPYPAGETRAVHLDDRTYLARPIQPSDVMLYPRFLERMDPEDMRLRFLVPTRQLSHETLVRLTQLDYDRDIAFVALEQPGGDLAGIARYAADPDRNIAEFGIMVRSDLKGHGLGRRLMLFLIDYARREGVRELFGRVLRENINMLSLCAELGFVYAEPDDPLTVRISLPLAA